MDLSVCRLLGNVDEEMEGMIVGHVCVLITTCNQCVASFAAGEVRKTRLADEKVVAAAAKQAEKLAKMALSAKEKVGRATEKERKRVEKAQKEVCSEGRAVARFGESVA